jgi:hypothetical protein
MTMSGLSRSRPVGLLVAMLLTAAGCSSGASGDDYSYRPATGEPASTTTAAEPDSTEPDTPAAARTEAAVAQPPKPAGSVPRGALGTWVGGLGSKEDFTFIVVSKDEYQLEHRATPAIPEFVEQGWIVGDSGRLLLRPVNAQGIRARERTVSWFRQPNDAGIDLLVINDPVFGELDYVRDSA